MIADALTNAFFYRTISPGIARGLLWLSEVDDTIADGRYEIEGDDVYALVQSYETVAAASKSFEAHRRYVDIQYVVKGCETIYHAGFDGLAIAQPYQEANDYELLHAPEESTAVLLNEREFAIFFQHDAHKPGCHGSTPGAVKKIVIKVRL